MPQNTRMASTRLGSTLRIAAWTPATRALGPGLRFALWVQGCPFSCPGCVAPEFLGVSAGEVIPVEDLVVRITASDACDGLTVSGGEPLAQAEALADLLEGVRAVRDLSVVLYSGYYLAEILRMTARRPALHRVLATADVLIDGRYEHALNDSRGLRGSTNQTVHFLTRRHRTHRAQFERASRRQEVQPAAGGELMVGLPTLAQWRQVAKDPTGGAWYSDGGAGAGRAD